MMKVAVEEVKKEVSRKEMWGEVYPEAYETYSEILTREMSKVLERLLQPLPRSSPTLFEVNDQLLKLAHILGKFDQFAHTSLTSIFHPSLTSWVQSRCTVLEEAVSRVKNHDTAADVSGHVDLCTACEHTSGSVLGGE